MLNRVNTGHLEYFIYHFKSNYSKYIVPLGMTHAVCPYIIPLYVQCLSFTQPVCGIVCLPQLTARVIHWYSSQLRLDNGNLGQNWVSKQDQCPIKPCIKLSKHSTAFSEKTFDGSWIALKGSGTVYGQSCNSVHSRRMKKFERLAPRRQSKLN